MQRDIKQLKLIGDLEFNFQTMTERIAASRQTDYLQMKQQIEETIRNDTVYEREENTRKLLLGQVNVLKHRKSLSSDHAELKMEMENRALADKEISDALAQYKQII